MAKQHNKQAPIPSRADAAHNLLAAPVVTPPKAPESFAGSKRGEPTCVHTNTIRMAADKLRPHPLQVAFFNRCSDAEDQLLFDDLRKHGLRDPIVVMPEVNKASLPAFTILDGSAASSR